MISLSVFKKAGTLLFAVSILASCQNAKDVSEAGASNSSLSEVSLGERNFRAHLVEFHSAGYEPYTGKFTSLDIGVLENKQGSNMSCSILAPRAGARASRQVWAPADFYTNIRTASEQNQERARLGEPNIFWAGDDNNRNGKNQGHSWTVLPDTMLTNSMSFEDKNFTATELRFLFRFVRKGINFERLVRARVRAVGGECVASAEMCGSAGRSCSDWKKLRQVVVHVDVRGGLRDRLNPPASDRERNDVAKLQFLLSNLDAAGNPTSNFEEVIQKE